MAKNRTEVTMKEIAMDDDNSMDESELEAAASPFVRKSSGGGGIRRASLGDSFSIESEPDYDDADDANDAASNGSSNSSSSDPNNDVVKVVDNHHPTIVAYEAELRRAFAAVGGGDRTKGKIGSSSSLPINKIDEATNQKEITSSIANTDNGNDDYEEKKVGEYKRGTSDYWEEKIQKKEEEKQQRKKLKGVLEGATTINNAPTLQTKSSCAVAPIDLSIDNEKEGDKVDEENGTTTSLPHVNDNNHEKEEPTATQTTTTKYHKKCLILSILLLMGLVLILGLVIGLKRGGRNGMNGTQTNNLRGDSDSAVSTVKPVESYVPNQSATNITDPELSTSTTVTTESAVEMAPAASTTSSVEAAATTTVATTAYSWTTVASTTLICNPITPSTTTTTASSSSSSSSEQCPPDSTSALQLLEKCTSSYNNTSPTTTATSTIDRYGTSIAINHDNGNNILAVIGANFDNHATLLRYEKVTRSWSHFSDLNTIGDNDSSIDSGSNTNNDNNNDVINYDRFGSAVTISSKWIAISTPYDTSTTGYVTLYRVSNALQNGNNAVPDVTLSQEDATLGSRFGSSLAMDDDLLVIGAVRDRNGAGSVYIYRVGESLDNDEDDNDNGWTQVTKLQPEDVSSDDPQGNFGHSVAISQGIVVVGAPNDTCLDSEQQRCGSVYIFQQAPGGFAFVQKISPEDLSVGDQFGYSVTVEVAFNPTRAVREDRIAIGTHMDDDKGMNSGSVYVFVRRDGERLFSLEQKLLPKEWSPRSTFGTSVDMQGHRMIVGSEGYGVAHLFEYEGESWIEVGSTNDADSGRALTDDFGSSVGIASWDESDDGTSAGVVLVGAPLNDENGEDSGQIYSYSICS